MVTFVFLRKTKNEFGVTDEKGDTKKIYEGVKRLSDSSTNLARTRPTERHQEKTAMSRDRVHVHVHRREEKVTDTETEIRTKTPELARTDGKKK